MRTKVLIVLIAFLFWGAGSTYWYVCKIKGLCIEDNEVNQEKSELPGNLLFEKGSSIPETNNLTKVTLDSIGGIDFDTLYIKGLSYQGEDQSLGLSRAKSLKRLLLDNGLQRPVIIESKHYAKVLSGKIRAFEIESILASNEEKSSEGEFSIEKKDNKIIIYFPSASADPHTNDGLMSDLKSFSKNAIDNKSKMQIIGHTDNSGTHEVNVKYGQLRADAIAKLLSEFGVADESMVVKSMGENEPIASNNNEEGKRKNRRVEIITLDN